jgi:hypothetical protein
VKALGFLEHMLPDKGRIVKRGTVVKHVNFENLCTPTEALHKGPHRGCVVACFIFRGVDLSGVCGMDKGGMVHMSDLPRRPFSSLISFYNTVNNTLTA